VRVAWVALPKKPGTETSQLLNVRARPFTWVMSLIWKTPARLVFGPCSGVPALVGVVERRTTSPGAAAFGPGWKLGALGSLNADVYPERRPLACWLRACRLRSTLKVPPTPALSPGPGETTLARSGRGLYEPTDAVARVCTGVPVAETGSRLATPAPPTAPEAEAARIATAASAAAVVVRCLT
jgi:hypothetical protein